MFRNYPVEPAHQRKRYRTLALRFRVTHPTESIDLRWLNLIDHFRQFVIVALSPVRCRAFTISRIS
jgi:hypothetical protein